MITIEQAIYGEKPGVTSGHGLLMASDKKSELFKRISGNTDLADRPEGGVLQTPVVRGFFVEDYFMLVKTFPDKSPELRSGRVFAHALLIRKADLSKVNNISELFQYHLAAIDKEANMTSIEHIAQERPQLSSLLTNKERVATKHLLEQETVIWLTEEGYWQWLNRIWSRIPVESKTKLRIGAAYNPQYIDKEKINAVYIPGDSKSLWTRHSFQVIDTTDIEPLKSSAVTWLTGNIEEAPEFQHLLDDFSPQVNSISILKRLQDNGRIYHKLDQNPELGPMLAFANFVSRVSPNEKVGQKGKKKLVNAIFTAIKKADSTQIKVLIHQTWKGFPDAIDQMRNALSKWLINNLLTGKNSKGGGGILVQALQCETANWWTETVLGYTDKRLKSWQAKDAHTIWHWMLDEPDLIGKHSSWLPDKIEKDLANVIPQLEKPIAKSVAKMAREKGWLLLHAKTVVQLYKPDKAIEEHLSVDTDTKNLTALRALSKTIKASDFVLVAAHKSDSRLHQIAGELIAKNSKLLKEMDVTKKGWQECWKETIEKGGQVWTGVQNPKGTLFQILDHLLQGNLFNPVLLEKISISEHNSLKDYPNRNEIWGSLTAKARQGFIVATIADLISDLIDGELQYGELEKDLQQGFHSDKILQNIISSSQIQLHDKIQLFKILPYWTAHHAQQLIELNQFEPKDANELGQLILENSWSSIAGYLYNERFRRKDLIPALNNCSILLKWWQRISLHSISGLAVSNEDIEKWWSTFTDLAIELYPEGPNQNGLWEYAGGDKSQLYIGGSGRKIWRDAIPIIRHQEKPNIQRLIQCMLQENSHNETLLQLKETL